jgi:hypothetical protein
MPPEHWRFPVQALLHVPQLSRSVWVLTQLLPHAVVGAEHMAVQPVGPQKGAALPQAIPHPPQFRGSLLVFTHALPQVANPVAHLHMPPVHDCPTPHAFPHVPQCALSVCVFTHVLLQDAEPAEQPPPVPPLSSSSSGYVSGEQPQANAKVKSVNVRNQRARFMLLLA